MAPQQSFNKKPNGVENFSKLEQLIYKSQHENEKNHRELMEALTGNKLHKNKESTPEDLQSIEVIKTVSTVTAYNLALKCKLIQLIGYDNFMTKPLSEQLIVFPEKVSLIQSKYPH